MNFPLQAPQWVTLPQPQQHSSRGPLYLLTRNRYQLTGAFLFAVLLPAQLAGDLDIARRPLGAAESTAIGTFIAVLLGAHLFRRLIAFPGEPRWFYVVASFFVSFGGVIAIFSFLWIDHLQLQFIASCLAAIAWFIFLLPVERAMLRPRLLVLPGGDVEKLLDIADVDWDIATDGEVPGPTTGIVADLRVDLGPTREAFLARCAQQGLPVYHSKQVHESLTGRVAIEHLSENTLSSLLPSSAYMRIKRLFDILGVVIAAPLAVPITISAIVLIKLIDGGPVLFRQTRMGFRGKPFTMYKLRTMRMELDPRQGFTEEDDPRISRLGRVLRRFRIDELPQIINIVKGDMSWIGPRPESIELSEWYERRIPYYSYRHIVRPGITGWAQVNQGNVAMIEAATVKLHYDFYYIKHFSPWLEILIAARTVSVVLTGYGAR